MLGKFKCLLVAQLAAFAFTVTTASAQVTPKYLDGVWTIASKKNCGLNKIEHMVFRANGTFESRRFGVTESTGFWRYSDDVLVLHLVTSPEHFDKRLKEFKGYFDYFLVKVLVFNQEPDNFEAFGLIGDQIHRETLVRCKG